MAARSSSVALEIAFPSPPPSLCFFTSIVRSDVRSIFRAPLGIIRFKRSTIFVPSWRKCDQRIKSLFRIARVNKTSAEMACFPMYKAYSKGVLHSTGDQHPPEREKCLTSLQRFIRQNIWPYIIHGQWTRMQFSRRYFVFIMLFFLDLLGQENRKKLWSLETRRSGYKVYCFRLKVENGGQKQHQKDARVMSFFVENSLPVTLSREVSNANLSENESQNRSRYLFWSTSVGCYSTSIVWKGEKRCNILDTSSTIAGNRILVSLLFVKLETTCGRFVDFWWFSFWNKTVIIIFYSTLFCMVILS